MPTLYLSAQLSVHWQSGSLSPPSQMEDYVVLLVTWLPEALVTPNYPASKAGSLLVYPQLRASALALCIPLVGGCWSVSQASIVQDF